MRNIFLALVCVVSVNATELIFLSSSTDKDSLKTLADKYADEIIIDDNRAYLVPSECKVQRHFGGLSQNIVNSPKSSTYTAGIIVTQEVFEADDESAINKELQKQNSIALAEGKSAQEFLTNTQGHFFGGLSQNTLDFTSKIKRVKSHDKHNQPTCQLLDDGSGYKLYDTKEAKIYKKNIIMPINEAIVLFK